MRPLRTLALALALATAVGCSGDEPMGEVPGGGTDDCAPKTCEDLGAQCGSVDNGCGLLLDCGGCEAGICDANACVEPVGSCQPKSCEPGQCGFVDDGCGGIIDCSGCEDMPGTLCSEENQCVTLNCGGVPKNECNTCGALPLEPGAECACEGFATCTTYGLQCDDGDVELLDDTDDGYDEFTTVDGIAELTIQNLEYDEYRVVATDERFSLLQPEFQITHPGGYDLNVCVIMDGLNGPVEAFCGGNDDAQNYLDEGVRRGCCLTLGPDQAGTSSFELDFPLLAPLHDYSARYDIQVRAIRADPAVAHESCEPYSIAYRF